MTLIDKLFNYLFCHDTYAWFIKNSEYALMPASEAIKDVKGGNNNNLNKR